MTSIGTFAPGTGGIRTITVPNPPPGNEWHFFTPNLSRLRLLCGRATLDTSAAVADRRVQFYASNGSDLISRTANFFPQPASTTSSYTLTPGVEIINTFAGFEVLLPFPSSLILVTGDDIGVYTTGMDANDQWYNIFLRFEEWIEV